MTATEKIVPLLEATFRRGREAGKGSSTKIWKSPSMRRAGGGLRLCPQTEGTTLIRRAAQSTIEQVQNKLIVGISWIEVESHLLGAIAFLRYIEREVAC